MASTTASFADNSIGNSGGGKPSGKQGALTRRHFRLSIPGVAPTVRHRIRQRRAAKASLKTVDMCHGKLQEALQRKTRQLNDLRSTAEAEAKQAVQKVEDDFKDQAAQAVKRREERERQLEKEAIQKRKELVAAREAVPSFDESLEPKKEDAMETEDTKEPELAGAPKEEGGKGKEESLTKETSEPKSALLKKEADALQQKVATLTAQRGEVAWLLKEVIRMQGMKKAKEALQPEKGLSSPQST